MKTLIENWRRFNLLSERINCLDPDSGKRFIRCDLVEIQDSDHTIPISPEETRKFMTFFAGGLDSLHPGDISPEGLSRYYKDQKNNLSHKYLHQLALGLTFLRENGIIFDDLKASNIMEKGNQVAIIDIGYSAVEGDEQIPFL
jgi:serine/threonine protein kinase